MSEPHTGGVAAAEVIPYSLPLAGVYRTAATRRHVRRGFFIRLRCADDLEGWGEAAPLAGRTEGLEAARKALDDAARALTRQAPESAGRHASGALTRQRPESPGRHASGALTRQRPESPGRHASGASRSPLPGTDTPAARWAVDLALADVAARRAGRSLAAHWAAELTSARRASAVRVNLTLPMLSPTKIAARAIAAAGEGIRSFKLKVGGDAGADLERTRALREATGPDAEIRLDANEAWSEEEAARRIATLAPFSPHYVEQPLPRADLAGLARLRERLRDACGIRIAADEAAMGIDGVRRILAAEAADVLVLKPAAFGSVADAFEAVRLANDAGVEVVITSVLDAAVGRAGALHFAAALGPSLPACGLATGRLFATDVAPPETVSDGCIGVPDALGIGFHPSGGAPSPGPA